MDKDNLRQRDINLDTLVFFDVETTGINPEIARIIEIGAVKTKNPDELSESFVEWRLLKWYSST